MKVNMRAIEMTGEGTEHKLVEDIGTIQKLLDGAFQFTGFAIDIEPAQENDKKMFCECCGLPISRILEKLSSCEFKPMNQQSPTLVRTDGMHFQYERDASTENFYTKRSILTCCEYCGVLLREEDIHSNWEIMGECGGRPARQHVISGYTCHYCGTREEF
jgi:hypothetical protein